jgi:hypothetical protein
MNLIRRRGLLLGSAFGLISGEAMAFGRLGWDFGRLGNEAASRSILPPSMQANPPDVYVNFRTNQAYRKNLSSTTAAVMVNVTRASAATQVDSTGNWAQFGSGVLARTNLGASIWEARTNSIRNNTMAGAVAGTPGTLPTNWTFSGSIGGITTSIIGTGTDSGINYIDIQWSGSATGNHTLFFDAAITAAANSVWSNSFFLSIQAGSLANVTLTNVANFTGGGTNLSSAVVPATGTLGPQRFSGSCLGAAGTTAIQPGLNLAATGAVSVTLRIGWPQCELNSNATTAAMGAASNPILTTSAAVTRAAEADTLVLTGLPGVGSAATLYARATPSMPTTAPINQYILELDDGEDINQRIVMFRNITGNSQWRYSVSGSNVFTTGGPVQAQGSSVKYALAGTGGDQAAYYAGTQISVGAGVGFPSGLNAVHLGNNPAGANQFNGNLEEIAVWFTQRVPNATLQAITT